jgi:hypothetical protein
MSNRQPRDTADHGEGQHGRKTRERNIEQLESGPSGVSEDTQRAHDRKLGGVEGKRRLVEDREQHDEAEKNSERNRLMAEHRAGDDTGPVDTSENLHGHADQDHRADYQRRGPDGLRN